VHDVYITLCNIKRKQCKHDCNDVQKSTPAWWDPYTSDIHISYRWEYITTLSGRAGNFGIAEKTKENGFLTVFRCAFFDEMGQVSDEVLATLDIILQKVRNSNIYMGGILIIFSMDHTQIQPIDGHPFLTSCHIIPCFKMVAIEHSVQASNDDAFKRIQKIARFNYKKFETEPELINEFIPLCSDNFTFVDSWDNDAILHQKVALSQRIQFCRR
jgi:hypothetical protein